MIEPRIIAYGASDVGRRRANNEDSLALAKSGAIWWGGIFDGVGGSAAGEVASSMAAELFESEMTNRDLAKLTQVHLEEIAASLNREIVLRSLDTPEYRDMGTTLAALILNPHESVGFTVHAGDSRIYLLRDDEFLLLTRDHNVANDLIMTPESFTMLGQIKGTGQELTRCLGIEPFPGAESSEIDLLQGDRFVVCSDGLHGVLAEEEIVAIMADFDPRRAVEALIARTLERGAPDNVTVIVADVI